MPRASASAVPAPFDPAKLLRAVPAADLIPYRNNSKRHPPEQIAQIRASIEGFGWTRPILHDGFEIVAGHGAREAAMQIYGEGGTIRLPPGGPKAVALPAGTVLAISCKGWSEAQRRAYVIADNKIGENAEWDQALLAIELAFLSGQDIDAGITGFSAAEIEAMISGADAGGAGAALGSLSDRFGIPPFSVFNAREGWWQDQKRGWLALGIMSELGRGGNEDNIETPSLKGGETWGLTAGAYQRRGKAAHPVPGGGGGAYGNAGDRADPKYKPARRKPNPVAGGGSPPPLDRKRKATAAPGGSPMSATLERIKPGTNRPVRKATATPGGSAMPSASYGKNKARGDGRGRPMSKA